MIAPPDQGAASCLARAAQRDAAGDHAGAVNELAQGSRAGDAHCARLLGLRLLIGDRAPLLPDAGLRFLGEACDGGLPEAAARAAGLLALGLRMPPDWPQALAWLARSAAAGWVPAQQQLLALRDGDSPVADAATGGPIDWQRVAAAVNLDAWRSSSLPRILSDDPRIGIYPDFLPPGICALLMSLAQGRLEPARVYHAARREEKVDIHRTNTLATFHVDTLELVHVLVQARIAAACGIDERCLEPPSVLHYSVGQQFRDHYDFVDPASTTDYAGEIARHGQRMATFIVYLNDGYEGGETDFPRLGLRHRGSLGEGICFTNARADLAPEHRMLHAGRAVARGEKWIIAQFVRSKAMR